MPKTLTPERREALLDVLDPTHDGWRPRWLEKPDDVMHSRWVRYVPGARTWQYGKHPGDCGETAFRLLLLLELGFSASEFRDEVSE